MNANDRQRLWDAHLMPWRQRGSLYVALLCAAICAPIGARAQNAAIPDVGLEPGQSLFRAPDGSIGAESIDPFTGTLKIVNTDLVVPSNGGLDITIVRAYNGGATPNQVVPGNFGQTNTAIGWDIHFGRIWRGSSMLGRNNCVTSGADSRDNPVLELPDGSRETLLSGDSGKPYNYITRTQWSAKCLPSSHASLYGLLVTSPEGIQYTFDWLQRADDVHAEALHCTKILHPNGTSITIAYHPANAFPARINTVTHSEGQQVSFTYQALTSGSTTTGYLLKEIQLDGSGNDPWVYNYTAVGSSLPGYYYLDSVERPNGATFDYTYYPADPTNGHHLRMITTPMGGTVTYTYTQKTFPVRDNNKFAYTRVVSKKETGGTIDTAGTWNYVYTPATGSGREDETKIVGPEICTVYKHRAGLEANNMRWKAGVLLSRTTYAATSATGCSSSVQRRETYTWDSRTLTTQGIYNATFANSDGTGLVPVMTQAQIEQDNTTYTTTYSDFDEWLNARQVDESGQNSRTIDRTFLNDTTNWIVGRLKNETVRNAGTVFAFSDPPSTAGTVSNHFTERQFYSNGDLQSVSVAGVTTSYDWYTSGSNRGEVNTITDAGSKTWTLQNYKRGTARTELSPISGISITRTVNDSGTIASVTDAESKTTGYAYDDNNELSGITTARLDDDNTSITRTGTPGPSERYRVLTRGTLKQTRRYDGFGRLQKITYQDTASGVVREQLFFLDGEGRVTRRYLPNSTSSYEQTSYDALNRPRTVTHAGGGSIGHDYQSNNTVVVTDERGFATTYVFRSYGEPDAKELMSISARAGDTPGEAKVLNTLIDRNRLGQVTSITQGGLNRQYRYNSQFLLIYEVDPELGTISYGRDAVGNMVSRKVGSSGTTSYALDNLYRTDYITYPANGSQPAFTVDYDYYKNGLLKQVIRGNVTWDYTYDLNNNSKLEQATLGGVQYGITYGYDTRDSLASVTYPSGLMVSYQPNAFGQATLVSSGLGTHIGSITYFPNGQIDTLTYANGYTSDYGQNNRLLPTTLRASATRNGTAVNLIDMEYGYDAAANVQNVFDYRDSSKQRSMTYDGMNRLRTATGPYGSGGGQATGSFTYDDRHNVLTKSFPTQAFTYNYNVTSGRLDSITQGSSTMTYGYDTYGNVTANGRNQLGFGVFAYDSASNLVTVGGPARIQYSYDGNGRMAIDSRVDGTSTRYSLHTRGERRLYDIDVVNKEATDFIYLGSMLIASRSHCTDTSDADGDGIPTCVEWRNGLNPQNASDALLDSDGDGLNDRQEYQAGTNLFSTDTDGDGLSDRYERQYGLNALVADSNIADADGDTLTNFQEFQLGTRPDRVDTDGDGMPDNVDPKPNFNPAMLAPILQLILE